MPEHSNSNNNSGGAGSGNGGGSSDGGASGSGGSNTNNDGAGNGTGNSNTSAFDPTALTPEQLNQVLEKNPHIWKADRLAELREKGKKYDDAETARQAEEAKRLQDEGKFKELSEKQTAENAKLQEKLKDSTINQALTNKLAPLGVVNLEDALKLVDRTKVEMGDDGVVSGVDQAVEALKTEKPYLFTNGGSSSTTVGNATNTGNGGSGEGPSFKRSQLQGPEGAKFYREHRDEILKAQAAGRIEDDLGK